jgi:hypothetical protein
LHFNINLQRSVSLYNQNYYIMRLILLLATVLLFMNTLSAQRKLEIGVVSMANTLYDFNHNKGGDQLLYAGYSIGFSGSYFLNARFSVTTSLLFSRTDYSDRRLYGWCGNGPFVDHRVLLNNIEVLTSIRYMVLKNKKLLPYISAGFIQGSRSEENDEMGQLFIEKHSNYNYGGYFGIGAHIVISNLFSIDIEASTRHYAKQPFTYSPRTFFSPALTFNYRLQ